jgi:hypothetical protein
LCIISVFGCGGEGMPDCNMEHARTVAMFFKSIAKKIETDAEHFDKGMTRTKRFIARSFKDEMMSRGLFGDMWGSIKSWLREKVDQPTLAPY